jgi:subtilisin family serine protease
MNPRRLMMPWARPSDLYSAPGSVLVKLRLGEAPERVPSVAAVRAGEAEPARSLGIGALDRVLGHFSDGVGVARAHAASGTSFDELEQTTGVARTFHVATDGDCQLGELIDALRMLHVVETASPQYLCVTPFEAAPALPAAGADRAWATADQVGAFAAAAYEGGDASVVVGVLDTGVVASHPEFGANVRHVGPDVVDLGSGELTRGVQLLGDTKGLDQTPQDENGHGSACAGIIGARGLQIPPGLAGACTVLPARVLGSAIVPGRKGAIGVGRTGDIDRAVKLMTDKGVRVMNLSFGTPLGSLDPADPIPHADVVAYALARGCVLVAASGNSSSLERFTPACLDGVIAVGAVDADDAPCAFSTRGPHVALAAPGAHVVSVGLSGYAELTGTSFAAPFVTATAALLVSRARRRGAELDGGEAREILRAGARPWAVAGVAGHGAGVLDAHAALRELDRRIDSARGP